MICRVNNNIITQLHPIVAGQDIVIGIDASKTNTALAIGDLSGELLHWIELNGEQDGTTEYDALALCQKQRKALQELLKGANVKQVGIEDIITKVKKGQRTGMTEHQSRFKITCIFASLIAFFQDTFDITPLLINNQSWKHAILPPEFRKRDIGKGSLAYFQSIGDRLGKCSDDVTDAVCILKYIYTRMGMDLGLPIKGAEITLKKHDIMLISEIEAFDVPHKDFLYNDKLTLEQNATVMSNNTEKYARAKVKLDQLKLSEIYSYCTGKFKKKEDFLYLWVINESGG